MITKLLIYENVTKLYLYNNPTIILFYLILAQLLSEIQDSASPSFRSIVTSTSSHHKFSIHLFSWACSFTSFHPHIHFLCVESRSQVQSPFLLSATFFQMVDSLMLCFFFLIRSDVSSLTLWFDKLEMFHIILCRDYLWYAIVLVIVMVLYSTSMALTGRVRMMLDTFYTDNQFTVIHK